MRAACGSSGIEEVVFRFVRHNQGNETYVCDMDEETDELADLARRSAAFGATLTRTGNEARVQSSG